ncbi:lactate 2-monooxygenase [soil metagenome]
MPSSSTVPAGIYCATDYAALAGAVMDPAILAHVDAGSGHDRTAAANLSAFAGDAIVPRVLRPVCDGDAACGLGGVTRPHPILLAPVGSQGLFHPEAERAVAMGAAAAQSCFIASTMASTTLEDIAAAAGPDRWFQLYFQPGRDATLDLLRRAEAAGYTAIVATVDTPIQLPSYRALAAGFRATEDAPNLSDYPARLPVAVGEGRSAILNGYMRGAPGWNDLEWLMRESRVPVWVKGVLHKGDAREAVARGAAGVIVSNHGGRSLDGAPSSLSRLAGIRASLGASVPVLFDGGIRSGNDIFTAIALGADAVLVGRLQVYALAVAGALGVAHMIRLLREELEACMALAGCATLGEIGPDALVRAEHEGAPQ